MTTEAMLATLADELRELKRIVANLDKGEVPDQSLSTGSSAVFANIFSGTYTPTLTGVVNVAASTAFVWQYERVGNVVTVSGRILVDPTAAGATTTAIGISLPVASNFASLQQASGTGSCISTAQSGPVYGDATNDRLEYLFFANSLANETHMVHCTYLVI